MIQVDVFWSFAMGAAFASLAPKGLKSSKSLLVNKYFVYNVCYLSMIFAPSGIYLLWQHTGWESMYYLDKSMHGILPCIFACTNVLMGVLGFVICGRLVQSGHEKLQHFLWTSAYTCMFAILTLGYNRFLYAGSLEDWNNGKKYSILDFFHSQVFYVLLCMSVPVLPPLYYAMSKWPSEGGITKAEKARLKSNVRTAFFIETLFVSTIVVFGLLLQLLPVNWGFDRIAAFLIGQLVIGSLTYIPLLFIRSSKSSK